MNCSECRYLNARIFELSKQEFGCMKTKGTYNVEQDKIIRDFSCFKPIGWKDERELESARVREARECV